MSSVNLSIGSAPISSLIVESESTNRLIEDSFTLNRSFRNGIGHHAATEREILSHIYTHEFKDVELAKGLTLSSARIGYTIYATQNGVPIDLRSEPNPELALGRPIVLIHPALTGSACALTPRGEVPSQGDGWAKHWFGSARSSATAHGPFIDTDRLTVICVDHFAGNGKEGSSTTARELTDSERKQVRFSHGVSLIARALEERGVTELHAVIGGSIGGGQAYEWLYQDRIHVNKIFDISGSGAQSKTARDFFALQRDILNPARSSEQLLAIFDSNFNKPVDTTSQNETNTGYGDTRREKTLLEQEVLRRETCAHLIHTAQGKITPFEYLAQLVRREISQIQPETSQIARLECARRVGFLRFVPPEFYDNKIERVGGKELLERWFQNEGPNLSNRFSPEALSALCNMNINARNLSAEQVAERLSAKGTRLIGYTVMGDTLFPSKDQQSFYAQVQSHLSDSEQKRLLFSIGVADYRSGHDHFLTSKFARSCSELVRELYQGLES